MEDTDMRNFSRKFLITPDLVSCFLCLLTEIDIFAYFKIQRWNVFLQVMRLRNLFIDFAFR